MLQTRTVTETSVMVVDGMCWMYADNSPDKCSQSSSVSEYRRHFYVCNKLPQPTLFPLIKSHLPIDKFLEFSQFIVCLWKSKLPLGQNLHPSSVAEGIGKWSSDRLTDRPLRRHTKRIGIIKDKTIESQNQSWNNRLSPESSVSAVIT